jgi:hypothetical protein
MEDFAIIVFLVITLLIRNQILLAILMCPLPLSVFCECIWRNFNRNDTIFTTLSVFLLLSGLVVLFLGIGLSSPLLNITSNSSYSINTRIEFNDKNLSILNTTENGQIFIGTNTSKISFLNITTTLEPKKTAYDFGLLGIFIGVVSLGFSIHRDYEPAELSKKERLIIATIWVFFGIVIILYGYALPYPIPSLSYLFGFIYLDFGLLYFLIYYIFKKDFNQTIEKARLDLLSHNAITSHFSLHRFREQFNMFISDTGNMESVKIRAYIVTILSLILIVYGIEAILNPTSFLQYLPGILIFGIGAGSITWAVITLCNREEESEEEGAS